MSGMEIERKFLVKSAIDFHSRATHRYLIKQGYIPADGATVRIRLRDDEAFLTIKSRSTDGGLSRYEFEQQIPVADALQLLELCRGGFIEKERWLVPVGNHVFEVDEFHGRNEGLRVAEVELGAADEPFEKPDFIGEEVTGDPRFRNSHLISHPFCFWTESLPEAYR